jgi:hypothetical protein
VVTLTNYFHGRPRPLPQAGPAGVAQYAWSADSSPAWRASPPPSATLRPVPPRAATPTPAQSPSANWLSAPASAGSART